MSTSDRPDVGYARYTSVPEPPPRRTTEADGPTMHEEVIAAIRARAEFGLEKYGVPLMPNNGRSWPNDATDEFLDLWAYIQQGRAERAAMAARIAELEARLEGRGDATEGS